MKRWQYLPGILGALVLAVGLFWGYQQMQERRSVETALNNKYHMAFYEMTSHVRGVEVLLSKTLVGQDNMQDTRLLMDLWQEAESAQRSLSQVPVQDAMMARTVKYLNQVSDYSNTLAKQTMEGKPKSEEQWQTLKKLYSQAGDLNTDLAAVERRISDGTLTMGELASESRGLLKRKGPELANNDLQTLDKKMQRFPTLIYDGPFSDHLEKRKPLGITGPDVTSDQARTKALNFVDKRDNNDYVAGVVTNDRGSIPVYRVEISSRPVRNNEKMTVAVSRQGGNVIWTINSRDIGNATISAQEAVAVASKFLKSRGFNNMEPSYYEVQSNMAVCNFAATQDKVIIYPDLIKVSVALDNGQVTGFEAKNYWMSHRQRDMLEPSITLQEARSKLSSHLTDITPGRLAVIPLSTDTEALTYEFQGRLEQNVFLIYINAKTGREERVLRVVRTNKGVLTL